MATLQSGINKTYKERFVVDEYSLRRIEAIMIRHKKDYAEPTNLIYKINREDDRFYETDNLDDVLSDPNVANSKVSILYIQLRKEAKEGGSKSDDDIICQIKFERDF